jgi:type VI protein secretion system component VasK
MANELHDLLRNCEMNLSCYVIVTKLDLVNGFQDYSKLFEGDLRHQILGFENNAKFYNKQKFEEFQANLYERLTVGAKQLLIENARRNEQPGTRVDTATKIWTFPDTFNALNENIKIYLDTLFGENNYHGTGNTYFKGIYFTSAQDMYISLSPAMAALSGLPPDELIVPGSSYRSIAYEPVPVNPDGGSALMAIPGRQLVLAPVNRRPDLRRDYFIRMFFTGAFSGNQNTRLLPKERR